MLVFGSPGPNGPSAQPPAAGVQGGGSVLAVTRPVEEATTALVNLLKLNTASLRTVKVHF